MENTSQTKKTNWAMIILLIILVPVLLLGYKFISKKMDEPNSTTQNNPTQNNGNTTTPSQNTDFPTGTWYRNDPNVNSKYIFDTPQTTNGTIQGQVDMVNDDKSEGKVNYEVIGDGKMRISDPQGSFPAWEMGYSYNSGGQTLEIIANGHSATYIRNPVYVAQLNQKPTPSNANNTASKQSNKVDISQLPPVGFDSKPAQTTKKSVNFAGEWVYMNRREPGGTLTLDFQQNGSQIYGLIYSDTWDASGNSKGVSLNGEWTINGDIVGNRVDFTIRNGNGAVRGQGTLTHNGGSLDFKTTYKIQTSGGNEIFPQHVKLIKQ